MSSVRMPTVSQYPSSTKHDETEPNQSQTDQVNLYQNWNGCFTQIGNGASKLMSKLELVLYSYRNSIRCLTNRTIAAGVMETALI